ncbi:MAG TPA: hypothetical protein VFP49_00735 [Nitrososphaeraceae archaeon]|nr:hypothetical protein [Nitrososphaeraceae archaeon]
MNPTNTDIVEINTSLGEYKAYSSAITALAIKPKMPAKPYYMDDSTLDHLAQYIDDYTCKKY